MLSAEHFQEECLQNVANLQRPDDGRVLPVLLLGLGELLLSVSGAIACVCVCVIACACVLALRQTHAIEKHACTGVVVGLWRATDFHVNTCCAQIVDRVCSGQVLSSSRTNTRVVPRDVGGLISLGPSLEYVLVPPKALDSSVEVTIRSFDANERAAPASLRRQLEQRTGPVGDRLAGSPSPEMIPLGSIVSLSPDGLAFVGETLPLLNLLYNDTALKEDTARGRRLMVHVLSGSDSWDPVPDCVVDAQQRSVKVPIRRFSFYVVMSVEHSPLVQNASATVKGLGNVDAVSSFDFETNLTIFLSGLGVIAVCFPICFIFMKRSDWAARLREQAQAEKDAGLQPVFSKLSGPAAVPEGRDVELRGKDRQGQELEAPIMHPRERRKQPEVQEQAAALSLANRPTLERDEIIQLEHVPGVWQASAFDPTPLHPPEHPSAELVVVDYGGMFVTAVPEARQPLPLLRPPEATEPTSTLCLLLELTSPHQGPLTRDLQLQLTFVQEHNNAHVKVLN